LRESLARLTQGENARDEFRLCLIISLRFHIVSQNLKKDVINQKLAFLPLQEARGFA